MPPTNSQKKAALGRTFHKVPNTERHDQPSAIYKTEEIHLGHVTQNSLKIIPAKAINHTTERSKYPVLFPKEITQIGV